MSASDVDASVPQLPLQSVPDDVATDIADLSFAGRYVPAGPGPEPVAGDFYDLLRLQDDLVAIVIGDVAGHGAAASARMQQLRAAARAYAMEDPAPGAVIARLDRFCARVDPEGIATLWYGLYTPDTGVLTYASGGHPPPILSCHGEPGRLLAAASTPPLGVGAADAAICVHHDALTPGAVLVAYSDGLVERRGADIDTQVDLLRELVSAACDPAAGAGAAEIAMAIMNALIPAPGSAEDDVCLLVVRRSGGPAAPRATVRP